MGVEDTFRAVEQGAEASVRTAIKDDPDIVRKSHFGDYLLHCACHSKSITMVSLLLDANADPNEQAANGRTSLHYAVHEGDSRSLPIVELLLSRGADPSIKDNGGYYFDEWAAVEMADDEADAVRRIAAKHRSQ